MTRRPVAARWWLLTDPDGVRYLRFIPREPERGMATRLSAMHVPTCRHRARVRFGAWEERPQGAAVGRSGPGTGGSEGPQIPGPENAYKCEGER